jgi:DNA-directed RNA polymerase subunit E'/Rpb7
MTTRGKYPKQQMVVYNQEILSRIVQVNIQNVGKNVNQILEQILREQFEGKCTVEGFIKPNSIMINEVSSGLVIANKVEFNVIFQCQVCFPVEGMEISCVAKNITKAGIRCETTEIPSPIIAFIARDHHYSNDRFANIKEGDIIKIKVIGQRFELYDSQISIIGELII